MHVPLETVTSEDVDRSFFRSLRREHGFEPLEVEGTLPPELRGTLFRNGPGLDGRFGRSYSHIFEGDGAVAAVRLDGGGAFGAHRLVQTEGLLAESAAGELLYGFGAPWLRRVRTAMELGPKNAANTNVIPWQGRLFALWEGGLPTELDPATLDTLGTTDLGAIPGAFSAHPHVVGDTLFNFGLRYGRQSELDLFALKGGHTRLLATLPLYPTMLHDFIATETHLVFFVSPLRANMLRALSMVGPVERLLEWRPELGTEVIVVPLANPERPRRFTVDPFYQWHFTNAYDHGNDIVVELVRYEDAASITRVGTSDDFTAGRPYRAVISGETVAFERLWHGECEFPRVDPRYEGRRHTVSWVASLERRSIVRLGAVLDDVDEVFLGEHHRPSEPVFVPRSAEAPEGDGFVLSLVYEGASDRSYLAVFDTRSFRDGPVAKAWFDHHVPVTFHGNWAQAGDTVTG